MKLTLDMMNDSNEKMKTIWFFNYNTNWRNDFWKRNCDFRKDSQNLQRKGKTKLEFNKAG